MLFQNLTTIQSRAAFWPSHGGETAAITESPGDEKKQQKSRGHVEAREARLRAERIWLKKSVQAQSLNDPLDLASTWEPGESPSLTKPRTRSPRAPKQYLHALRGE